MAHAPGEFVDFLYPSTVLEPWLLCGEGGALTQLLISRGQGEGSMFSGLAVVWLCWGWGGELAWLFDTWLWCPGQDTHSVTVTRLQHRGVGHAVWG